MYTSEKSRRLSENMQLPEHSRIHT